MKLATEIFAEVEEIECTKPEFRHAILNAKYYSEEEVKAIFDKFDEYSCIKDDKWYKDLKEEILK